MDRTALATLAALTSLQALLQLSVTCLHLFRARAVPDKNAGMSGMTIALHTE
jgi:hypothetical protein